MTTHSTDTSEVFEAEHRALAVRGETEAPPSNVALFGTNDPVDVINRATRVADALKAVVVNKKLVTMIQGKEYPQVEAWQTLAVMLGLAAVCEWSRPVEDGWEARVIVQRNGETIAAAEAQCLKTERSKKGWEDYAIRSMAQTRATSKSLRSVLGFVMVLAGYQATPAEEMPGDTSGGTAAPPQAVQARVERKAEATDASLAKKVDEEEGKRDRVRAAVMASCKDHGINDDLRHHLSEELLGWPSMTRLTLPKLRQLKGYLKAFVEAKVNVDDPDEIESWITWQKDLANEVAL